MTGKDRIVLVILVLAVLIVSLVGWAFLTYFAPIRYPSYAFPLERGLVYSELDVADLNGDDLDDVVISGFSSLEVVFQNRTGGFENRTVIATGEITDNFGKGFVLGDFNADGFVDIFSARSASVNPIFIAFNDGAGGFGRKEYHNLSEWSLPGFGGMFPFYSGNPSVTNVGIVSHHSIDVLSPNETGVFVPTVHYSLAESPHNVIAEDLDGNNQSEIIVVQYDGNLTVISLTPGQRFWTNVSQYIGPNENVWLTVADIDGDGVKDVGVASNLGRHRGVLVFFSVASGLNDPIFAKYYNSFTVSGATTGDLDEDGDEDVILSSLEGSILTLVNEQTGELTNELLYSGLIEPHSPALIHVRVGEQLRPAVIIISQIRDWYDLNEMQLIVIWRDESGDHSTAREGACSRKGQDPRCFEPVASTGSHSNTGKLQSDRS